MDDLINRQDALNCFHAWVDKNGDVYTPDDMPEYQAIEALPSAQRTGEWIETEFLKLRECSCCHVRWGMYDVENFNFCPNCGAKMRKESE